MKGLIVIGVLLLLLSGCGMNTSDSSEERPLNIKEFRDTMDSGTELFVYVPTSVQKAKEKVPLVLALHGTDADPTNVAYNCGWVAEAAEERFILVAPRYADWEEPSEVTVDIAAVIAYALRNYPVDASRVYVTGFSKGGVVAAAMARDYPQMIAAIAPMGWITELENVKNVYTNYDMPFQLIQGTKEFTRETESGAMAVMEDERRGIRDLLLYNEMIEESCQPDYERTPYWGYVPKDSQSFTAIERAWTISNYYKEGYVHPFAQLVLIEGAEHVTNAYEATVAWEFLKKFHRETDGTIKE